MLKIDLNLLWVFINLIIFFVFMKLVLFKPIKKAMDKRQELIDSRLDGAAKANAEAEAKLADYESKIADYEAEGEQIISEAKSKAKTEYGKILDKAEEDAQLLKENAEKEIRSETEKARRAAKEELASLAIEAAEKVVGETITADKNSAIFDEFLNEGSNE